MIKLAYKSQCSGCTACVSVCKHNAISMEPDNLGFLFPKIDTQLCVNCGLCDKVCAFNENYDTSSNFDTPQPYAARQKNISEVLKSQSGGIFAALSDIILECGGVIYGAAFDSTFKIIHKRAIDKIQRDEFRGSKYVQSNISGIFKQVETDLLKGLYVLFSGTPCQVAGIKSYLQLHKVNCSTLLTCDLICHGVSSPKIWIDYLRYIEQTKNAKITCVNFRDKRFGWASHIESFKLGNNQYISNSYKFYQNITFRHSCNVCPYSNLRRPGDITLGDFWGYKNLDSDINADNNGISLIFVNTKKGDNILKRIYDKIFLQPVLLNKCIQPNLTHPTPIHPLRNQFEKDYIVLGFKKTMEKYAFIGWRFYLKKNINLLKSIIWKTRKKFMR